MEIKPINEDSTRQYLSVNKWPDSLQDILVKGCERFPVRYFVIDDSGSMARNDGHRKVGDGAASKWTELTDAVKFHAGLAEAASLPTEFRLLNGSPPIVVGRQRDDGTGYRTLMSVLDNSPGGGTPLCSHLEEVTAQLKLIAPQLRANSQKAVIIIATDGEASDGNVSQAMKELHDLPVWVVIRLCTDEPEVDAYWSRIDAELELDMDVLDDLCGEAMEINKHNNWFTYGEPLHRLREWGVQLKEMDLIDEAPLSADQMRAVCALMFASGKLSSIPHPDLNWLEFENAITVMANKESPVWDVVKQREVPWIKRDRLRSVYNRKNGCNCM